MVAKQSHFPPHFPQWIATLTSAIRGARDGGGERMAATAWHLILAFAHSQLLHFCAQLVADGLNANILQLINCTGALKELFVTRKTNGNQRYCEGICQSRSSTS